MQYAVRVRAAGDKINHIHETSFPFRVKEIKMADGAAKGTWYEMGENWELVENEVVAEILLAVYVNGKEIASIMCTPLNQEDLVLGFLLNEGFISGMDEIGVVAIAPGDCCADIWLKRDFTAPTRVVITSGCGGGLTFDDPSLPIKSLSDSLKIEPQQMHSLINSLHSADSLHARTGGIHTGGLADSQGLLLRAEDIGRHNTIDRLAGAALRQGIDTRGKILLSTGRISSEMLRKGVLMGCPIIGSRTSPTSMSVAMAQAWGITLVGYIRRSSLRVYTHPERLGMVG